MPRAERGTPKDIANRMKAKGLQKLRWYCQMCQKQCRDENGFKCHTMSESHQRQLLLFADNSRKYLDSFSYEFREGFLNLLKRRFSTKRVLANAVYQEYIKDRHHIHMNATRWVTLTGFVKWLGRQGLCTVDETEKGWYIAYIDKDYEAMQRQEKVMKRVKNEKSEEERLQEFINKQIALGKHKINEDEKQFNELVRDEECTISFGIKANITKKELPTEVPNPLATVSGAKKLLKEKPKTAEKKRSALDEIMEEEKRKKKLKEEKLKNLKFSSLFMEVDKSKPNKAWLAVGIIIKVITKDLGSKYYRQKGVVLELVDEFCAIVKMLDSGTKIKLDQVHVETVVPSPGRPVLIIMGGWKGEEATLVSVEEKNFTATLKILSGKHRNEILSNIPYEYFSKLHTS